MPGRKESRFTKQRSSPTVLTHDAGPFWGEAGSGEILPLIIYEICNSADIIQCQNYCYSLYSCVSLTSSDGTQRSPEDGYINGTATITLLTL